MNVLRSPLKSLDDALVELLGFAAVLNGVELVSTFDAEPSSESTSVWRVTPKLR